MSESKQPRRHVPNDRINKAAQELGYCCAFMFLLDHSRPQYTHAWVAKKLKVGLSTVEFNRRKMRHGESLCLELGECQLPIILNKEAESER